MSIDTDEATRELITRVLPTAVRTYNGPECMSYYLGAGKDGTVFRLFDPANPDDHRLDEFAVKIWNKGFRSRSQEIDLQRKAYERMAGYRVPEVVHDDLGLGCFVMERVPGNTLFEALIRREQYLSESFLDEILHNVQSLNAAGITHDDLHRGNLMLSEPIIVRGERGPTIIGGELWIIDFGRSRETDAGRRSDKETVQQELEQRVVADPS